ncbi:MAG: transglutaminase domain protein [Enterovirga sp.]|nr:transglutaminase domain protein [Enterovirga sp.]
MPTYSIRHVTTYRYAFPVAFGEHRLMLRARDSQDQRTLSARLSITPHPQALSWSEDPAGNPVGRARFGTRARELRFEAAMEVEVVPLELPLAASARGAATNIAELAPFTARQHADPDGAVERWARAIRAEDGDGDALGFLTRLSARIRQDFTYRPRLEKGIQSPVRTLRLGSGSCRDFAVLMGEGVRALGFASRFASGYLHVPGQGPDSATLGGHTHAWTQVHVPGIGWVDFDPTCGSVGNRDLVRVALVRDPEQAAPLSGSYIGYPDDFIDMRVEVTVERAGDFAAPGPVGRKPQAA